MRRRLTFTGIVVALAITASACGGGTGGQAAVSIKTLQAAVSNTQDAESSRFEMHVSVDTAGEPTAIDVKGVMSADGKTGQLTLNVPMVGSIEERIVDGTIYMDFGDLPFASELGGTPWVKVSLDELKQHGGELGDLADRAESNSPQQGLEYLQGLSGDVEKVGDDTVAGQHATHYRASIDYADLVDKLPDASAEVRDELAKLGTVPADVWINDEDRVVKMHLTIDGSAFGAGAGTAEMTMEITDFGVPVDVQAPPEDETIDFSELTGSVSA